MASALHRRAPVALLTALSVLCFGAAEASAATKIKKANAVDRDGDGSVDGFDVTFSAKVRQGKARPSFTVRGFKVTAVAKPNGKRVRVRVAEGSACDLGALPRITYKRGLTDARKRKLRGSRIDLGKKDKRRPRITCAVTRDTDSDGHLDTLTITWSRPVRSPAVSGGGPFGVDRYTITSAAPARGRYVTLKLKEKSSFDTGEVPALFYWRPKLAAQGVRATARRRGSASSTTYNDTRDRALAKLVSARTADSSLNGLVDGVTARFSESVKADPTAITVEGARVTSVAKVGRDSFTAAIAEGPLPGQARPQVSFGTAAKVVRDLAGNAAPRTSVQAADGAAPVIVAARTLDRGGFAGRLDTLALTWSEPVSHPADGDGSYPFGVTSYPVTSASAAAGTALDLALAESGASDTGSRPPVGYTRGAGAPVRDAAGNEAPSHTFAGVADAVPPRLLGATTEDSDTDGKLDHVRFDFSEPISSPQRACSSGCGFSMPALPPVTALAGAGSSVSVTATEGSLNGGLKPATSYSPLSGGSVRDAAGNAAPAANATATDGAAPVALDAYTQDTDSNGKIDEVRVGFSEPLSYPGDAVGQTSFTATGYTVGSVDPASGSNLVLNLVESADPDTGSAPAVGYNGNGGVTLRDANGVEHVHRSWPNLTRDQAPPRFVGARTADINAGVTDEVGKVDAVELVYSEEIVGTPDVTDFQVDGADPAEIAFDPQSVKLRVAEGAGYDTDSTKTVSYTPGDLHDVPEGPGDTADAAPAASTTAVDGAEPAIVAAETADTGTPNGKVDHLQLSFSEPVTYTAGPTPAFALADPALAIDAVAVDSPTQFTLTLAEAPDPDGGAKPSLTVTDTSRVTDVAGNPARGEAFGQTADKVAPVLMSARFGEAASGVCGSTAVDGSIDCVRATWSEPVSGPADASALVLDSPFAIGSLMAFAAGPDVDATLASPSSVPDRDRTSQVTYTGGGSGDVTDVAGNSSLTPTAVSVKGPCRDSMHEPNDSQGPSNPSLTVGNVSLERICAFDGDWFRIAPNGSGTIGVSVDPSDQLATNVRLVNSDGSQIVASTPNGVGALDSVTANGLSGERWLHVTGAGAQEGAYCIDTNYVPGEQPCNDDEPPTDQ